MQSSNMRRTTAVNGRRITHAPTMLSCTQDGQSQVDDRFTASTNGERRQLSFQTTTPSPHTHKLVRRCIRKGASVATQLTQPTAVGCTPPHRQPRLHEPHSVGCGVQQPQAAVGGHPAAEARGVIGPGAAPLGWPGELAYITLEDVCGVPWE